MQNAIATLCLSGSLPEKLEAIAAAGFDGVEIFEDDLLACSETAEDIGRLCRELGLDILLYQPLREVEGCPREHWADTLARVERRFDWMQALGTDLLLICSNTAADSLSDERVLVADLREIAQRAGARGLRVAYEGLAWGRHVNTWQQVWHLVRQVDHPALGVMLDSFHTLALNGDTQGLARLPAEKIFFVQLADAPASDLPVQEWSRHLRCFPGQGQFDLARFVESILRTGYRGPLSLEIFNDRLQALPAAPSAVAGLRALRTLRASVAQAS